MGNDERRKGQPSTPSRKSLRLTFRISNRKIELVSQERLEMITPPLIGERPKAGRHGGFWIELRDAQISL